MLHYFPPLVAGIIIPTLVVIALIVIPYFNFNIQGRPFWSGDRKRTLWILWMVILALTSVLVWTHAWTVLVPTEAIAGLMLYAYWVTSHRGAPTGYLPTRPLSWWVMTWFIFVAVVLTLVGTFFRGPGWSWIWPWGAHGG